MSQPNGDGSRDIIVSPRRDIRRSRQYRFNNGRFQNVLAALTRPGQPRNALRGTVHGRLLLITVELYQDHFNSQTGLNVDAFGGVSSRYLDAYEDGGGARLLARYAGIDTERSWAGLLIGTLQLMRAEFASQDDYLEIVGDFETNIQEEDFRARFDRTLERVLSATIVHVYERQGFGDAFDAASPTLSQWPALQQFLSLSDERKISLLIAIYEKRRTELAATVQRFERSFDDELGSDEEKRSAIETVFGINPKDKRLADILSLEVLFNIDTEEFGQLIVRAYNARIAEMVAVVEKLRRQGAAFTNQETLAAIRSLFNGVRLSGLFFISLTGISERILEDERRDRLADQQQQRPPPQSIIKQSPSMKKQRVRQKLVDRQ